MSAKFDGAAYDKKYYKIHKAEIKKRKHEWYVRNKIACNTRKLEWRRANAEQYRKYRKEYYKKYPEIAKAGWKIRYARRKKLVIQEPCAICNKIETECHHFDYTLPMCVVHLCGECHKKIHNGEVNEKQIQEVFVYEI